MKTFKPTMALRVKVLPSGDDLGENQHAFMFGKKHPSHAKPAILQQLWTNDLGAKQWRNIDKVME